MESIEKDLQSGQQKKIEEIKNLNIVYKTNYNENYLEELLKNRKNDINKGYTALGIHRDDFDVYINDKLISVYGSQGQLRTAIISLKLAEAEVIYEEVGERPIILLDDFMSELDKKRIEKLLDNIKENQVIITCTDNLDIDNIKFTSYKIISGKIEK